MKMKLERYKRTRNLREIRNCGEVVEYVWQNGALVPIQWLREEYHRRLAGMGRNRESFALTAAESFKEREHGWKGV